LYFEIPKSATAVCGYCQNLSDLEKASTTSFVILVFCLVIVLKNKYHCTHHVILYIRTYLQTPAVLALAVPTA